MKNKSLLTTILILIALAAATGGSYAFSRFFLDPILPVTPGLPSFSRLNLPPQTQNGITATLESYYADATRLDFRVRLSGGNGSIDTPSLKDENGTDINSSAGFGPVGGHDPSVYQIEFNPVTPLGERLTGKLNFGIVTFLGSGETIARFSFDFDIPVHPALVFNPKQVTTVNGVEILLDRVVITPAYTQAYLCYIKPSDTDWMIGNDAIVQLGFQQGDLNAYSMLFDSSFGEGTKGGEPGWIPPVQIGRCIKAGFPVGDANPQSITLTIPALEQSMPEVIPADELAVAYPKLLAQGIDMEWHTVDHGAYPEYKKLPAGMSEQAAFRKFIEALGYIYKGPWVFNLQLKPQVNQGNSEPVFSTSLYGSGTPIPFPINRPHIVATLPGRIRSCDISPDSETIGLATSQGVVLYDLQSSKLLRILDDTGNDYLVAWSPDGKKLATGSLDKQALSHLAVWDTSTWQVIFEKTSIEGMFDTIYGDIAWSPDSKFLADSINETGVLVHNIQTGEVISHQDMLSSYSLSWSPDGTRLVGTGDLASSIRRWIINTDQSVRMFDQRYGGSLRIAWSPDGKRIASANWEGLVCLWTAETNKCDGLIHAHQYEVFGLAWSSDGNQLATGSGVIRVWDSHTGQLATSFGLLAGSVYTRLKWAANYPLVSLQVGKGDDAPTIVRFWDVKTGSVLFEFQGASGMYGQ